MTKSELIRASLSNIIYPTEFSESGYSNVKAMIRMAVEGRKRNYRHSGLCGQAPSDYPEMAELLVETGIDSMSLNPDVVLKTTRRILEVEQKPGRPPGK